MPGFRSHLPPPTHRSLRGYAFDPSLAGQFETARVNEVTFKVPWEAVQPGPVGEYLEVVDVDPPSRCAYQPVDLDAPHIYPVSTVSRRPRRIHSPGELVEVGEADIERLAASHGHAGGGAMFAIGKHRVFRLNEGDDLLQEILG